MNPYLNDVLKQITIGDFIKNNETCGIIKNMTDKGIITDENDKIYNLDDDVTIIKYNKKDSKDDLLLKGLQADMDHLVFRTQGTMSTRIGFNNSPFFFGFTGKENMLHLEKVTPNHPEIYSNVLYYQAGNYSILKLNEGKFEFKDEIHNRMQSLPVGAFQIGIVGYNEGRPRYNRWIYCGVYPNCPIYYLYLLIMYGEDYYVLRGNSKEKILKMLYITSDSHNSRDKKISEPERHLYQAYAHVVYYKEDIPESYGLDSDLRQKIIDNYSWIYKLHDEANKKEDDSDSDIRATSSTDIKGTESVATVQSSELNISQILDDAV